MEVGGGGGGEHLDAGGGGGLEGLQPRRGQHGQARGAGVVHAAATPLERKREEGEREQLGGGEEQQVAPRRGAAADAVEDGDRRSGRGRRVDTREEHNPRAAGANVRRKHSGTNSPALVFLWVNLRRF